MKKIILFFIGGATLMGAQAQNALSFDGVDDKVNCGNHASIQLSTAMTIEAWIYPTSWRTNVWEGGIVVKEQNSSNNGYMFRAGSGGKLNVAFGAAGLPWRELTTTTSVLTLNVWQHVAAVYNGSKLKLYVNGIAKDSIAATGLIGNATNNVYIGGYYDVNRNFPGKIDEVRIWNVGRTQAQIVASMNGEFCTAPSGLVAYYKFNQGTAGGTNAGQTTLTDVTGVNNGIMSGFTLSGATSNWVAGATLIPGTGGSGAATVVACDSYKTPGGTVTHTISGSYTDTVTSALGCDSIVALTLTIKKSSAVNNITASGCNKYTVPSGKRTYTSSGTYRDTLVNAVGCDSLLSIAVTINTINVNVLQNGAVLTSWLTGAAYQWLDCGNGYAKMTGANSQSFFPPVNGSYAVEVTKSGCTDTSTCYSVTGIGILENGLFADAQIYPQPSQGSITVAVASELSQVEFVIYDLAGKKVFVQKCEDGKQFLLHPDLSRGVYMLHINALEGTTAQRIVFN